MDHRFLAETIALRPMLFRAMLEFNRGSSCAVPEALAPFGNKAALLWKTPSFRRAWPVRRKQDEGYWNFSEESQRLALMDAHTLGRLGLFLSAAAHAEELSRVILASQVHSLRQEIGADVFHYALKRGRYQIGSLRALLLPPPSLGPLPWRIHALAVASLDLVRADWPEPLRSLAAPRFPVAEEPAFRPELTREQRMALWFTMKKLLLREVAPQWAPCFD